MLFDEFVPLSLAQFTYSSGDFGYTHRRLYNVSQILYRPRLRLTTIRVTRGNRQGRLEPLEPPLATGLFGDI